MAQNIHQQDGVEKLYVPRFILPDFIVRKQLKEIEAELAHDPQGKAHLHAAIAEYKEHLLFQDCVREAHSRSAAGISAIAVAQHGADAIIDLAHQLFQDRVIPPQPNQSIGNMMNAVDKDYSTRLELRSADKVMELPGKIVKQDFDDATKHVYDNALVVYEYYREVHNRDSLNNKHLKLVSSVHYGRQYANAFWTPVDLQMVYGDGNPRFLTNIVQSLDVAGHEMTHGVIDQEGKLDYQDESGALNESIADVFGIMVKQYKLKQTVAQSDWLIGAGTVPNLGNGLRSFTSEPANRMDIQPKTYVGIDKWKADNADDVNADNGGVHLLSGITNHAFYLFCKTFPGADFKAYDGLPAKIWYGVVVGRKLKSNASFHDFATLTVEKAQELGGDQVAASLKKVWVDVGINLDGNHVRHAVQAAK